MGTSLQSLEINWACSARKRLSFSSVLSVVTHMVIPLLTACSAEQVTVPHSGSCETNEITA